MSGLFNTYYYGKAGKADYTVDQMPANRISLFFTVLRQNIGNLIKLNLIYDVFCLPMIVWIAMNIMVFNSFEEQATAVTSFVSGGLLSTFLLILIPCMMIMGIGSAGQMYILRNWSKDQHAFLGSDFKDSIKTNWKAGLGLGTINGFSFYVLYVGYTYYGMMAQNSLFFILPQTLMVVLFVVWWMMNQLTFSLLVSYEMKFRDLLRNAVIMSLARLPFSVLFLLVTFGLSYAVLLIPYGQLVLPLYFVLIGFSVTGLIQASFANSCFDKYMNPRIEGAKVGVGMRDPSLDYLNPEEEEEIRKEAENLK